jgi:hypothetical protein
MKTITISDEAAKFIAEFTDELKKQDRRVTADPYYYVVRRVVEIAGLLKAVKEIGEALK